MSTGGFGNLIAASRDGTDWVKVLHFQFDGPEAGPPPKPPGPDNPWIYYGTDGPQPVWIDLPSASWYERNFVVGGTWFDWTAQKFYATYEDRWQVNVLPGRYSGGWTFIYTYGYISSPDGYNWEFCDPPSVIAERTLSATMGGVTVSIIPDAEYYDTVGDEIWETDDYGWVKVKWTDPAYGECEDIRPTGLTDGVYAVTNWGDRMFAAIGMDWPRSNLDTGPNTGNAVSISWDGWDWEKTRIPGDAAPPLEAMGFGLPELAYTS